MESKLIINSIVLGGVFFAGLILFWFIFTYVKKRATADQSRQGHSAATKFSWQEKRQYPRVDISWQAILEKSGQGRQVHLKDISLGGAFVICQEPLNLKDQFKISINLPDRGPLQLNAEVVWSNANIPEDTVVNRGMGIRFIKNEEKERQQLQDAIAAALKKIDESIEKKT